MADSFKKKQYNFPECNKEAVASSLRLLKDSITDLRNSKRCFHEKIRSDVSIDHLRELNGKTEKKRNSFRFIRDDIENLDSEQLLTLRHELLKKLKNVSLDYSSFILSTSSSNKFQLQKHTSTSCNKASRTHSHKPHQSPPPARTSNERKKSSHQCTKHKNVSSNNKKVQTSPTHKSFLTLNDDKISQKGHTNHTCAKPTSHYSTYVDHNHFSQTNHTSFINGQKPTKSHVPSTTTLPKSTRQFKLNLAGIPFVSGKSTTKSHSLSANLQEVLYLMKHNNTKTFCTKPFSSMCRRSCLCNRNQQCQQQQQQHRENQQHKQNIHQRQQNKNNYNTSYNIANDDVYEDDDNGDDDDDNGDDDDESYHKHNDDESDNDIYSLASEDNYDDTTNDNNDDKDDDGDDDDDDDDEMLQELLEQLTDELSNLKARYSNLAGLEGSEGRREVLHMRLLRKQKQVKKVQEVLKEHQLATMNQKVRKMEKKKAERRIKANIQKDQETNQTRKTMEHGVTSAHTTDHTSRPTNKHTDKNKDEHTYKHIDRGTTAKQKQMILLKDLQQIQNSLKHDVH